MNAKFQPECLPTLIGSIPMNNHPDALRLVLDHTPEIPLWVQLPVFSEEGMMTQFLPGLPGLTSKGDKTYIDTAGESFDEEVLRFYEEYVSVTEGISEIEESAFALTEDTASGFFEFLKQIRALDNRPVAVKGQITGPLTLATGIKDQNGKSLFYDPQLRDIIVKQVAMKARWQARVLAGLGAPVIIFFDEPAFAGFGSSEFISISKSEIQDCITEVSEGVHSEGAMAGVHVCANCEWSLVLESGVDIVNFDAYSFFDKFILYPKEIKRFVEDGGILAWGIVPTLDTGDIEKENVDSLTSLFKRNFKAIEALGIEKKQILKQSLITPSCGTGTLSLDYATRVLKLTSDLSEKIRTDGM